MTTISEQHVGYAQSGAGMSNDLPKDFISGGTTVGSTLTCSST
jgi:hypothetical protein